MKGFYLKFLNQRIRFEALRNNTVEKSLFVFPKIKFSLHILKFQAFHCDYINSFPWTNLPSSRKRCQINLFYLFLQCLRYCFGISLLRLDLHFCFQNKKHHHIIGWTEDGSSFMIHKPKPFTDIVLPSISKHSNLSSFIRQVTNIWKCWTFKMATS